MARFSVDAFPSCSTAILRSHSPTIPSNYIKHMNQLFKGSVGFICQVSHLCLELTSFQRWSFCLWVCFQFFFFFSKCGQKVRNINFITFYQIKKYTLLSVQFSSVKDIHIIAQQNSRTFSSCKTETLLLLITNSPSPSLQHLVTTILFSLSRL